MTIMASRPVRSTDRLIDAPTVLIPRQATAPAVEQGAVFSPLNVAYRSRQGDRARQAYAALTAPGVTFTRLPAIAAAFGVTARDLVELAIEHADSNPDAVAYADRDFAACPPWCATRHAVLDVALGYGLSHETAPAELVGDDPAYTDTPATAAAWVERTDDTPGVGTAPRVVLALTQGADGHYPGSEGVQGWSGTVEQVEQLGQALLELVATVRAEQVPAGTTYRVDVFDDADVLLTSREVTAVDDQGASVAARELVDELSGAVMAAVFTASLVYVGTVTR